MQNMFKTDYEILKENFKFIWDTNEKPIETWEETFAKSYYDKLYKEYCISDLSFYKKGKIGLRWCNEKDLIEGKGLKICGNTSCQVNFELSPYEVNMAYKEEGEYKNALVKVFLCQKCARKLKKSYKYLKRKRKRKRETEEN